MNKEPDLSDAELARIAELLKPKRRVRWISDWWTKVVTPPSPPREYPGR